MIPPPAMAVANQLAETFGKRFPVKVNGDPAGLAWWRRDGLVVSRLAPRSGHFGSRRGNGTLWLVWARESMLGSRVELRTGVGGETRTFTLGATPAEAWGYLARLAYGLDHGHPHLGRDGARAHLGWVLRVLADTEAAGGLGA